MSAARESGDRAQQLREKARHMAEAAERTSDPEQRQRLQEKARKLQEQCEQQSDTSAGNRPPQR
ncbi:DUF6381 family protein [Streptomyces sp. NPDC002476]|uniref:DUF6381 family protein n=1 Tax=Streptomyces sp. NPDC002476 TaxID=3364648 RepID=UPI0036CDA476